MGGRHLEAVEGDLVFLHAAVAEHLDLAAAHALGREGLAHRAARLFGDEHREALVAGLARVGARHQGHQVRARAVGDPGLVAGDAVERAVAHRPGLERSQVGAGAGLGEDRGDLELAARDAGQPPLLLRLGAALADQLGGGRVTLFNFAVMLLAAVGGLAGALLGVAPMLLLFAAGEVVPAFVERLLAAGP